MMILLMFFIFLLGGTSTLTSADTLVPEEVEALKEIAKTLGKKDWDFSVDPCSQKNGWFTSNAEKGDENAVTCSCNATTTLCNVVSIVLKSQSLPGKLPPELVKLTHLQEIDLTRNYLNGTLPPEWASLPLVIIVLIVNRLTGPIPKEYGSITTLQQLKLDDNQLSGSIPKELGDLPAVQAINLSSNNFTGELPDTFSNLTTLNDFRISDNYFTGTIPSFIQGWTNLSRLEIQASGLDGPLPSSLDQLYNLMDLRISDLNGTEGKFPLLSNLKNLKTLILRSCHIVGQLPEYLGAMDKLKTLDLSFNKLSGVIPNSFASNLSKTDHIYLTGNLLSGPVPAWITNGDDIDISYNNLTLEGSGDCQQNRVNLFKNSLKSNATSIVPCLGSSPCSKNRYSFYINCGGRKLKVGGLTYEDDTQSTGSSKFFRSQTNWASSSTGHFLDNDQAGYIQPSTAVVYKNLTADARLSPISLTYYGFCLLNGKYTVRLHFAEIMFTDDETYKSLGRRIFDVYIQEERVLKDFNIKDAAGGVGKEIIKKFPTDVTNHTLEIRFYWAGRGTTLIPTKGVYGPLISAISVRNPEKGNGISAGAVVGIVFAVVSALFLVLGIIWWKCFSHRNGSKEQDMRDLDLPTGSFSLRQIRLATNNFDNANKIGEGGFGPVFKGILSDGTIIAVKQLSSKSKQGNREFVNEIGMISALQHPHLVKLYGCCIEGDQLLLVYEYMENNSLARALFGSKEYHLKLDWPTRYKICIGIARGLAYLHEESRLKIVHRDIKATNVLLDKDLNPKISDFGLAKLDEEENTHISTRIAGTFGYMAPEYAMRGYLTDKADVYSYGIVALEIVSGRSNTSGRLKQESFHLLDWALALKDQGNLMELVDESLGSEFNEAEVALVLDLALLCADVSPAVRPAMSSVVSILEGRSVIQDSVAGDSISIATKQPMETQKTQQKYTASPDDTQLQSMSMIDSWAASSTSTADLYPLNFESEYWKNRI